VELLLPCPAYVGPRSGANGLKGHHYSCGVGDRGRSLPRNPQAHVDERVVDEVVLPEE
jgi:hypothetical protein